MANDIDSVPKQAIGLLKTFFQGPIVTQFNDDNRIWAHTQNSNFKADGYVVSRPLKTRRNQGIGATSDLGLLPDMGRQTVVQALVNAKYNYLRFAISGPLMKQSQTDKGSFVRGAAYELMEGYNDFKADLNRQLGYNGNPWLAQLSSGAVASSSITISGRETGEPALKFVDVGLTFDIYSSAGVQKASAIQVTAITAGTASSATATLTLSAAVTASAGDYLVRKGSYGNEIQGLLTQLDGATTTLYTNLDRAAYPALQANYLDLGGAQLSLNAMQQMFDEADRRGNGSVKYILADHASGRMYIKLLTADKRYVNTEDGAGGWSQTDKKYAEFNGALMIVDKDFAPTMVFCDDKNFEKMVWCELEVANESGSEMIAIPNQDAYETRIRFFANFFNSKAAATSRLTNYVSP